MAGAPADSQTMGSATRKAAKLRLPLWDGLSLVVNAEYVGRGESGVLHVIASYCLRMKCGRHAAELQINWCFRCAILAQKEVSSAFSHPPTLG